MIMNNMVWRYIQQFRIRSSLSNFAGDSRHSTWDLAIAFHPFTPPDFIQPQNPSRFSFIAVAKGCVATYTLALV